MARSYCNAANIMMAQANKTGGEMPSKADLAKDARALVRKGLKASLATIAAGSGYPYASLITVASDAGGAPIFLISGLAQHTRNLGHDSRASILFDGTGAAGDPLQGARVTLFGVAEKTADEAIAAPLPRAAPGGRLLCRFSGFRLLAAGGGGRPLHRRLRPHRRSGAGRVAGADGGCRGAAGGGTRYPGAYERGP